MKRIILATAEVAVVAVSLPRRLARASRQPRPGPPRGGDPGSAEAAGEHQGAAAVGRRRQVRRPAVRLHQRAGKNAGFDVEIAKWFARYAFGRENRVTYVCAPTPAREPLLTTDRVDLVISTFTYTPDRDTRIDFSRAYYKATGGCSSRTTRRSSR